MRSPTRERVWDVIVGSLALYWARLIYSQFHWVSIAFAAIGLASIAIGIFPEGNKDGKGKGDPPV